MDKSKLLKFGGLVLAVIVGLQANAFLNSQLNKAKTSAPTEA